MGRAWVHVLWLIGCGRTGFDPLEARVGDAGDAGDAGDLVLCEDAGCSITLVMMGTGAVTDSDLVAVAIGDDVFVTWPDVGQMTTQQVTLSGRTVIASVPTSSHLFGNFTGLYGDEHPTRALVGTVDASAFPAQLMELPSAFRFGLQLPDPRAIAGGAGGFLVVGTDGGGVVAVRWSDFLSTNVATIAPAAFPKTKVAAVGTPAAHVVAWDTIDSCAVILVDATPATIRGPVVIDGCTGPDVFATDGVIGVTWSAGGSLHVQVLDLDLALGPRTSAPWGGANRTRVAADTRGWVTSDASGGIAVARVSANGAIDITATGLVGAGPHDLVMTPSGPLLVWLDAAAGMIRGLFLEP